MRLDQHLSSQKMAPSRSQIARWIDEGHVLVNGKKVKASYLVKPEDQIQVTPPKIQPSALIAEEIPLDILYEDDVLLVLNKPASLVVHPGAGHATGTLVQALLAHCKGLSSIGGVERPGIVHRLDKGTSGVMVIAKNDLTHQALSEQFKNHQVTKIYWALVYGKFKKTTGTISTFLSRSPHHRKKFSVSESRGKKAVTHYRVLQEGGGLSWVELNLETGRTHQIRVHLTDAGHSVVGDPLYGGHSGREKQFRDILLRRFLKKLDHTLLHARQLRFFHPLLKKEMEFEAPLPEDFKKALKMVNFS